MAQEGGIKTSVSEDRHNKEEFNEVGEVMKYSKKKEN